MAARLHACARHRIPIAGTFRTYAGRVVIIKGDVVEVGIDHVVIRGRIGPRFAGRIADLIALTRVDGRAFARRGEPDAREELRDAAEDWRARHGGLE